MKVGTRVRSLETAEGWHEEGEIGTIIKIHEGLVLPIEVMWDERVSSEFCGSHELVIVKHTRQATLEIYKTKKGLSYRKIASNGKVLNHQYNTMAGLNKGIEAEKRFWENYKVVTK